MSDNPNLSDEAPYGPDVEEFEESLNGLYDDDTYEAE